MPGKRCVEVAERYLLCSVNAEQILEILENGFSESEAAKNEMHTAANYLYDNPEAGFDWPVSFVWAKGLAWGWVGRYGQMH